MVTEGYTGCYEGLKRVTSGYRGLWGLHGPTGVL